MLNTTNMHNFDFSIKKRALSILKVIEGGVGRKYTGV
jgi:hypothetical protein